MYIQYMYIFPPFTLLAIDIQSSSVHMAEEHNNLGEEKKWNEERAIHLRETQTTLPAQREEQTQILVDNYWFIQQDVSPKEEGKPRDI